MRMPHNNDNSDSNQDISSNNTNNYSNGSIVTMDKAS